MMINFPGISKLKTKQVIFQEVFSASDPGTLEQLKELSSRRRTIEESINESSSLTEAIAREMSGGLTSRYEQDIQKLEQYLPLLENLVYHVHIVSDNSQVANWISDVKISWSSVLTSSCFFNFKGTKYYEIDDFRFELGMIIFLYGAMLRERALEILQTDLVQSATLFRRAAGVYQHLAEEVLPLLQPKLAPERPPESVTKVSAAMTLLCLAEAQAVTARKAEERGNTQSLLSKLHFGVGEFLDEALCVLHSVSKECKDISSRFMDFITTSRMLHEFMSYRYLAESLMTDGKIGTAIGVLHHALSNLGKNTPKEESWRLVFKQVKEEITRLLQKYEHENDFVWHEKIPNDHELPCPEATKIVSSIPFHPQRSATTLAFKI